MNKKTLFSFISKSYSILIKPPRSFRFSYIAFIIFVLSGFYSSCIFNTKNENTIAVNDTLSAAEILSASINQMEDLNSFYFKSAGSISAAENLLLTQIQGEIIKPNYMNLQINGSYSSGLVFKTRLISHNGKSLILNPLNKKWEPASENFNPAGFFAPHKGVSKIMSELYDTQISYSDNYYQLNGLLNSDSLNYLLGEIPTQSQIKVSLSIGKNNMLLYHAKLNGKFMPDKPNNDLFIDITKHNQPTKIEIPIAE